MDVKATRKVGKSRLQVMPLGFGAAPIGTASIPHEQALRAVTAAWQSGVRLYDTAPWYGMGRSERRLGLALSGVAGIGEVPPRDAYRVNTKVGKTLVPEPVRDESKKTRTPGGEVRTVRDPSSGFRLAYEYGHDAILRQHQDSLQRLGLSSVDSLTIHDVDYGYHSRQQLDQIVHALSAEGGGGATALQQLRASGAISAIGCGANLESRNAESWTGSDHEDLCERIADVVDLDFFLVAGAYTLLETRALRRLLPLCQERDIGVIIGAPYASGLLAAPDAPDATYMYASPPEEVVRRARSMSRICERHGIPLAAAALQFPLAHPRVAAVIPGVETAEKASQNHRHMHARVPDEVWRSFKQEGLLDPAAPTPDQA